MQSSRTGRRISRRRSAANSRGAVDDGDDGDLLLAEGGGDLGAELPHAPADHGSETMIWSRSLGGWQGMMGGAH